jgi:hypothetical protein
MRNLAVRVALAGLFVVVCGAAAYLLSSNEFRTQRDGGAFRAFESAVVAAERDVLELRAAQQAYVAAGQGDEYWIAKVAGATVALRQALDALRAQATSPDAQSAFDNASSALQDFEQMDRRARDYTRSGQKLLASDLIFADSFESTSAIVASIEQARAAEIQAGTARTAEARRLDLFAIAGVAATGLLAVLLLAPRTGAVGDGAPHAPVDVRESAAAPPAPTAAVGAPLDLTVSRGSEAAAAPAPAPSVDFNILASLCGDLARVIDTRALPALLQRAATVLDAPGIVLWIADPDGRELSPIVTHGYPPSMVTRLGTILSGAENATASAFRTSLLQTVRADAVSNGAIAAPLVTAAGCVGVMAAEVRHEGEKDSAKLAAAAIVAAQLATLVGPPSTRAQAKTEAG